MTDMKIVRDALEKFWPSSRLHRAKCIKSLEALDRIEKENAIPEGWKLVPIDPTKEMKAAAIKQRYANLKEFMANPEDENISTISPYKAMLESAPKQPKYVVNYE